MHGTRPPEIIRKPKIRIQIGAGYRFVEKIVHTHGLNTVCASARCPNIYECWGQGTATIMILGDVCTRSCGFCAVRTGRPEGPDTGEPLRTALAVREMGLRHVVITSVDRDDLKDDFGAGAWAETIIQIRKHAPGCTVEALTPDFRGYRPALLKVFEARPDIFCHNVECVERISRRVRAQADWQRSLEVLRQAADYGLLAKSGIMVGLGETFDEVVTTMEQVAKRGVKIFTIGQYLQPTKKHLPVVEYIEKKRFDEYREIGLGMGFRVVEAGPLVRSSYHADEQARLSRL